MRDLDTEVKAFRDRPLTEQCFPYSCDRQPVGPPPTTTTSVCCRFIVVASSPVGVIETLTTAERAELDAQRRCS